MTLIKSISGIRGTIGGKIGNALTPVDIVKYTSAYAAWLLAKYPNGDKKVVLGRDARISGEMVRSLVSNTLQMMGIDVIDLGLSTTPTVEVMVVKYEAIGGIILTASHNPKQWNALKLLNNKGEFISAEDGETLMQIAEDESYDFSDVMSLGSYTENTTSLGEHIQDILDLELVDRNLIEKANFTVAVDGINSSGAFAVPAMLRALGVKTIEVINAEPNGHFAHNPEPLKEHLTEISSLIKSTKMDLGIVVDPDVDRLAFVCEDGSMFGEEYTLVAVADYILANKKGNTVSNMSSTRALRDITEKHEGCKNFSSEVGEVNVVKMMKAENAVIGGEGNGGIIYPESHYGRDALVGIALFLTSLAQKKMSLTALRDSFPAYTISKNKIELTPAIDVDAVLETIYQKYKAEECNRADGLKIYLNQEWVHLRKSNTEPIIRIYTESESSDSAEKLAVRFMDEIRATI